MKDETKQGQLAKLGDRIRAQREICGLRLHELARLTGISASALSLIETGKRDLRVTSLYRIAAALRISAGELLDGANQGSVGNQSRKSEGYDLGDYK